MATRDEMFPSKWLKASDVEPPIVATVEAARVETVGQGIKAERKTVLYFTGSVKPASSIAAIGMRWWASPGVTTATTGPAP